MVLLLLLRVVDDERVVVLLLLLRVADDERVALLVLPERISLLGREFICPDVVLPLRDTPVARVAEWLLVDAARVADEPTCLSLLFTELLGCVVRPRTAVVLLDDELPAPPIDDDAARAELLPRLISPLFAWRSEATPLAVVRRRP